MPQLSSFLQRPLGKLVAFGLLVVISLSYVVVANHLIYSSFQQSSTSSIVDHQENESIASVDDYWTVARMNSATDEDVQLSSAADFNQGSSDLNAGQAAQKDGQAPSDSTIGYPLSTIGKIFFRLSGRDYVCSGTAIVSNNHNTVDTAGHCIYGSGGWGTMVMFCPLYANGSTPYGRVPDGCWVAKELAAPNGWINARPNDLHQDFGMIVVYPNDAGNLTDVVGGAGWAYNQQVKQPFYAYGYPAGYPFNGQTRQSCENASPKNWTYHAGGRVVSIPCNMTGGSSGGGWFIKNGNSWYLDGHNDFTSTAQPGHMFSPYYDNTWYTLYNNAQNQGA